MKKIISLTKTLYKVNKNDSSKMKKTTKIFLYIILIAYLLFIFSSFWSLFINPLNELNKVQKSIELMLSIGSIFILITSITSIANILFFSEDTNNILPLPFSNKQIFTAKLLTAYLYALIIDFMILLPGFIAYMFIAKTSIIFLIYSIIILLFIPIIPTLLISIIYTIIMPFLKFAKYKNLFKIVTTILILVLILGFQLKLNANINENGDYNGEYILELCDNLSGKVPYNILAANALYNSDNFMGCISLILFIIMNTIAFYATIILFNNLYIKGIYANTDGTAHKSLKRKVKTYKIKSKIIALMEKEFKNLLRNSTFFVQCIFPSFLMPIIIIIMSISNTSNMSNIITEDLGEAKIIFGIIMVQFFMVMNHISVTAISRDGKDEAAYMKSLPIKFEKQITAKALPSILVGTMTLIISLFFLNKVIGINFVETIILFVCGILLNLIQSYLLLIIDLVHPKLYWESEMAVVKHNINFLYALIIGILGIVFTGLFSVITFKIGFSVPFTVLLLTIYICIKIYIHHNSEKLYSKII